jgi:ketosteroid isomerase-like protein
MSNAKTVQGIYEAFGRQDAPGILEPLADDVDEELHLWTFNDNGKVVRLRHYVDTAKHLDARRA